MSQTTTHPSTCCHEEGNAQFSCKLSGRRVVQGTFVFSLLDSPYSPIYGRQQIMLHLKSEHHISQIICFATVSLFIPDEEDFIPCCYNHTAEQTHRLIFEQYNIATGLLNISYLSKLFSFFAHSISLPINIWLGSPEASTHPNFSLVKIIGQHQWFRFSAFCVQHRWRPSSIRDIIRVCDECSG